MKTTFIFLALAGNALLAQQKSDLVTPTPVAPGQVVVIGFLGGFEKWDSPDRSVRKVALDLRGRGFAVETFENRRQQLAAAFLRHALDSNGDGKLDPQERAAARVILYGQSLGGDAAVRTARALHKLGVPVLLTVQVDSVGLRDGVIPSNVRQAANYYQHDLLTLRGKGRIRAADPRQTTILGNFERSYRGQPAGHGASWARRKLGGSHARMEMDPELWAEVEGLILHTAHR